MPCLVQSCQTHPLEYFTPLLRLLSESSADGKILIPWRHHPLGSIFLLGGYCQLQQHSRTRSSELKGMDTLLTEVHGSWQFSVLNFQPHARIPLLFVILQV